MYLAEGYLFAVLHCAKLDSTDKAVESPNGQLRVAGIYSNSSSVEFFSLLEKGRVCVMLVYLFGFGTLCTTQKNKLEVLSF